MFGRGHVEHKGSRPGATRLALVAGCALALALPGSAALAQAAKPTAPDVEGQRLSLNDQEVAATMGKLGLVLTEKTSSEMQKGWAPPKKAIVFTEGSPQWLPWLKSAAPNLKYVYFDKGERGPLSKEILAELADADVQIGGSCSKEILKAAKNLKVIISAHVGVEGCFSGDTPARLLSNDVLLTNQKRTYGVPIATHAIAMMLSLQRGLDLYVRMADKEKWVKTPPGRLEYPQGGTMLVVGLGGLGTDVARLGNVLGMKIIGTRATSREKPDFVDYVGLSSELPDLVGKADVVVSAVPLIKATAHMFNADIFSRMKKGALFINVSRGGVVDSDALVAALKSGQVGGAGLDVTEPEPLPPGHPLWHAPNIIITPHMSAHFSTDGSVEEPGNHTVEAWAIMRENLRRYAAGDRLYSVVDPKLGY